MSAVPRSILAVDVGAATTSVSIIGRVADRWRLLGSLAAASPIDPETIAAILARRIRSADQGLADAVALDVARVAEQPRLEARSAAPRSLAVVGASRRTVALLEAIAERTAWRTIPASPDSHDPREMTDLLLRPDVAAVVFGITEPPGPDERAALDDLAALVGAVARRRADLSVVLAGAVAERRSWQEAFGSTSARSDADGPNGADAGDRAAGANGTQASAAAVRVLDAPPLGQRSGPDEELREVLEGLLPSAADPRHTALRTLVSLADVLDRRIELVEIGLDGGLRGMAQPGVADEGPTVEGVRSARAALVPPDPGEAAAEAVLGWTTGSLDRHRMGDRLRDLRTQPWADASGDGARLRLAAARAAMSALVDVTPDISSRPAPDLTLVAGGAFAVAPGGAVALAVADVIRRTGATQVAADHARLLGPIGTIEDPDERRDLVADLADDLLTPLGSLVIAGGMPPRLRGRAATGMITLDAGGAAVRRELATGEVATIDLAPGNQVVATLEFRDSARIGRRARRFSVPVSGGLAGVIVDLRDVPLKLPERRDRRRAALATWGEQFWPADER